MISDAYVCAIMQKKQVDYFEHDCITESMEKNFGVGLSLFIFPSCRQGWGSYSPISFLYTELNKNYKIVCLEREEIKHRENEKQRQNKFRFRAMQLPVRFGLTRKRNAIPVSEQYIRPNCKL
jgi:hypothetical protein